MDDSSIGYEKDTYWITLVDTANIPNHILDELRDRYTNNFSSVTVYYESEGGYHGSCMFYDAMIGNPRIEEFMKIEIECLMGNFVPGSQPFNLFLDIMTKIIIEKRGSSADQFEEFIAHLGNIKSARNCDKKD